MTDPSNSNPFIPVADQFVCSIFPQSPTKSVSYTSGNFFKNSLLILDELGTK